MALEGGTFLAQDKVLPGAYVNFESTVKADAAISERGVCATILPLSWNVGNVVRVTNETFYSKALALFGCAADDVQLRPIREMLKHAREVLVYVAGYGSLACYIGIGEAKADGAAGNDIKIEVTQNTAWTEEVPLFDVDTYFGTILVDRQTGIDAAGTKLQDNDFVRFNVANALSAGTYQFESAVAEKIDIEHVQSGLDALEKEQFQALACGFIDQSIKELFFQYTKRCREEEGKKFQCVLQQYPADYEGIVNFNGAAAMVYWIAGALAGCGVQESLTNLPYNGELDYFLARNRAELTSALERGEFVFHNVGGEARVLSDCNSNVHNKVLASNQTVRVLDQIANDIAVLFYEQYLGKIQNNAAGRLSFWNAVVRQHQKLETLGAIEGFVAEDITITAGNDKNAVVVTDRVKPSNCMEKLYMTVTVL